MSFDDIPHRYEGLGPCRQVTQVMKAPPRPVTTTTIQGGSFHTISSPNAHNARTKSAGRRIALVHTGLYSAASRIPTTAALTPRRAAWAAGRVRSTPHHGSEPRVMSIDGRKMATSAIAAPSAPLGAGLMAAPR